MLKMFSKLVCWVLGHDRKFWEPKRVETENVVGGVFTPFRCLRCGYESQPFRWPRV